MMNKYVIGGGIAVIGSVLTALILAVPAYIETLHDEHNAPLYVSQSDYQYDVQQQNKAGYRRDLNALELRKLDVQTDRELKLIDQQIKRLERERDDYIKGIEK